MLSNDERRDWQRRLSGMPDPVHLLIFTTEDTSSGEAARRLGEELQALSQNVRLEIYDVDANLLLASLYGIARTPAFALLLGGVTIVDAHLRFYGVPTGAVRQALIDGIVAVGHSRTKVASFEGCPPEQSKGAVHVQVLVPGGISDDAHTLLEIQRLALTRAQFDADIVDIDDFPELAARSGVGTRMTVIVNDALILQVGATNQQYLNALKAATAGEPADQEVERMTSPAVAGGTDQGTA